MTTKKKPRLRLGIEPGDAADLVNGWGYPRYVSDPEMASAIRLAAENPQGQRIGLIWLVLSGTHLELHAASDPAWRGRWLYPQVIADVKALARLTGIETTSTRPMHLTPSLSRLYARIGFNLAPDGSFHLDLET